ncbi:hypothetical protein D9619_011256 [Psilocybe cf. subviscida]|uniref:Uncharacterized protein n=1 Tax=Psilocybe cf. subviscida TaxID=2480587 RepID=A0A8H5F5R7_9AGAR|nr:hypothetical protein D9619_011256 [Psilocybe cf. subviscida]
MRNQDKVMSSNSNIPPSTQKSVRPNPQRKDQNAGKPAAPSLEQHLFGNATGATVETEVIVNLGNEDLSERVTKQVAFSDASKMHIKGGFFGAGSSSVATQIASNQKVRQMALDVMNLDLERAKLDIQRRQLELEERRLQFERDLKFDIRVFDSSMSGTPEMIDRHDANGGEAKPLEQHLFTTASGTIVETEAIVHLGNEKLPNRVVKQTAFSDSFNMHIKGGFFGAGSPSVAKQIAANHLERHMVQDDAEMKLEMEKLEIERRQLELDERRLQVEWENQRTPGRSSIAPSEQSMKQDEPDPAHKHADAQGAPTHPDTRAMSDSLLPPADTERKTPPTPKVTDAGGQQDQKKNGPNQKASFGQRFKKFFNFKNHS